MLYYWDISIDFERNMISCLSLTKWAKKGWEKISDLVSAVDVTCALNTADSLQLRNICQIDVKSSKCCVSEKHVKVQVLEHPHLNLLTTIADVHLNINVAIGNEVHSIKVNERPFVADEGHVVAADDSLSDEIVVASSVKQCSKT